MGSVFISNVLHISNILFLKKLPFSSKRIKKTRKYVRLKAAKIKNSEYIVVFLAFFVF